MNEQVKNERLAEKQLYNQLETILERREIRRAKREIKKLIEVETEYVKRLKDS